MKSKSAKFSHMPGITALPSAQPVLEARRDASEIMELVMKGRCTPDAVRRLVRPESLQQLIFLSVEKSKSLRAKVNAIKSHEGASEARDVQLKALHCWLDKNLKKYAGRLNQCAHDARDLGRVPRALSWIRKEITVYRRQAKKQK